jgi:hypothetical protein
MFFATEANERTTPMQVIQRSQKESKMGSVIPSTGTYQTGRGPSPWVVSFPTVADKLDNFSATY